LRGLDGIRKRSL